MAVIEFFWEPVSPYTYLASTQIEAVAARAGAQIVWRPFLLGPVFEATGNRMNLAVPAKGRYMMSDLRLWAQHHGVPLNQPKNFPVNSVPAARLALAAPADRVAAVSKAVLRAFWGEGRDISQADVLKDIAAQAGLDGDALLAKTQDAAIKNQLRANTDEAISRGAFGAPTFFVGEQMFWGNDRLPLLEDFLAGKLTA